MNKIKIIILLMLCTSCNKKSEIKSVFLANKNDYWQCKDYCYPTSGSTYFQFKENGIYDRYLRSYVGFDLFNNDGDLESGPRPWSIKNDSTFVMGKGIYKIEKITNKEIILSYYHFKIKEKKCFIRLSKWVDTPKGPKLLNQQDTIKK